MVRAIVLALLLAVLPAAAHADPLSAAISGWLASAGLGAVASTVAGQLLSSVLLSRLSMALMGNRGQKMLRELTVPDSLPVYRFVYGETRAAGTPAPVRVKGKILYACYILNSRPSAGPFTVLLDKREVEATGNPYDFSGAGAEATNDLFDGYCQYWIGRGDQTAPPALILSEAGDLYDATDAWRGRTVIWLRLDAGKASKRQERWPAAPPEVMVDGKWSLVWDPRDPAQDPDDPATWEWSSNQALCVLDALRQNPLTPYDLRNLWLSTYEWGADVADEAAPVKGGGTIPRYEVNGTLAFATGAELEDQLQPLLDAGAARFVRARGQLGLVPATPQTPAMTLTDMLDGSSPRFVRYAPKDSLATSVAAKYLAPDREYEDTDAPTYVIPGAQAEDGGIEKLIQPDLSMVTDHRQVQRVQKIFGMRTRMQRTVEGEFPPEAFDLVAGSWCELDLEAPYARWSRTYEVEAIQPNLLGDDGSVALRCQITLRETSAAVYAWNAATEEQDVPGYSFDGGLSPLDPPGTITATTGAGEALQTGFGVITRIRFAFDPSGGASVTHYDWEWRPSGGNWTRGGSIDADVRDGLAKVFDYLSPAETGIDYDIRVRAVTPKRASAWVSLSGFTASSGAERYSADFSVPSYAVDGVSVSRAQVLTLTRASTGTYVDSGGVLQSAGVDVVRVDHSANGGALLVEPAATNAWTYSEEIGNAVWTKNRTTVTVNAGAAPDGTTTADKLVEDLTTGSHYLRRARTFANGTPAQFSFFVKAAGRSVIRARCTATGMLTRTVDLNLSTGAVTVVAGTITARAYALASGWYWLTLDFTPNASAAGFFDVFLISGGSDSYTGDGSSGALIWGLQDGAGSYIPTGASTASRAADVARMGGITATLDLTLTYGDGTSSSIPSAPVSSSYWPAASQTRIRRIVGTP